MLLQRQFGPDHESLINLAKEIENQTINKVF